MPPMNSAARHSTSQLSTVHYTHWTPNSRPLPILLAFIFPSSLQRNTSVPKGPN